MTGYSKNEKGILLREPANGYLFSKGSLPGNLEMEFFPGESILEYHPSFLELMTREKKFSMIKI